jgi:hypothetical protein
MLVIFYKKFTQIPSKKLYSEAVGAPLKGVSRAISWVGLGSSDFLKALGNFCSILLLKLVGV